VLFADAEPTQDKRSLHKTRTAQASNPQEAMRSTCPTSFWRATIRYGVRTRRERNAVLSEAGPEGVEEQPHQDDGAERRGGGED
jgi:hypothetical protein